MPRPLQCPLHLHPRRALDGFKYGINFPGRKREIYLSPAAFSLFQSDPELMMQQFQVKTINENNHTEVIKELFEKLCL